MQSVHAGTCFVRVGRCRLGSILTSMLGSFWEPSPPLYSTLKALGCTLVIPGFLGAHWELQGKLSHGRGCNVVGPTPERRKSRSQGRTTGGAERTETNLTRLMTPKGLADDGKRMDL